MAFSGALTLTDLNDFITPSQACIKPVDQVLPKAEGNQAGSASNEIRIDHSGSYYEVDDVTPIAGLASPGKKLEQAQISLNDCLACSGCITSAESVLITLQSHNEVLNFLSSNAAANVASRKVPVVSIAPQSLASLAASISSSSSTPITSRQMLHRLRVFCKDVLGFAHVFDTNFARHVVLREHVKEFAERQEKHRLKDQGVESEGGTALPMLASACPGWICYAEKAHPEMLPFIARTKSPQQVMGTLVKNWMGQKWGKQLVVCFDLCDMFFNFHLSITRPNEIYHVSVMPCYDKKLEASRADFYNEVYSTRDVDCVITTGEMQLLAQEKGWDLSVPVPDENLHPSLTASSKDVAEVSFPELMVHSGSSSGSYLQSIIEYIRCTSSTPLSLHVKQIRNADYEEFVLKRAAAPDAEDEVVFKGAKCYGFRNLQNVVRKVGKENGVRVGTGAAGRLKGRAAVLKRGRRDQAMSLEKGYDYVEVMACPGGCVNGGGQAKPPDNTGAAGDAEGYSRDWEESGVSLEDVSRPLAAKWGNKEWTKRVENVYWRDLFTPAASPTSENQRMTNSGEKEDAGCGSEIRNEIMMMADRLMIDITDDLYRNMGSGPQHNLFRTNYQAVESEVVGLAVRW
ncbi:iron hydrogenase [Lentinula guzmanii]|uniref:Cytosolic Fe-S cluster assembly factor NAR1 n=1 Tax=Lentinula guzmanii TaxID=2804957 RepID=A0AA38N467_9AGAR|nr:iron hydrogenase [Lentinula guzmanii]